MIRGLHALARALLRAALPADLRDAVLDDLNDEMRERIEAGSTPLQAMGWSARQSLGSLPSAMRLRLQRRAAIHDRTPGGHAMHGILQDIRYAGRMMRTHPLVTAAAIGTLALGIGATTAIFSVVHAALLRDLPFPESDRLVRIHETFGGSRFTRGVVNPSNFDHWERHATSFSRLTAMRSMSPTLTGAGEAGRVALRAVTPTFFDVIGVSPAIGRRLTGADGETEAPAVLLSHGFWVTRFGADPDITARRLFLDGTARPIAGVMPEGFTFPYDRGAAGDAGARVDALRRHGARSGDGGRRGGAARAARRPGRVRPRAPGRQARSGRRPAAGVAAAGRGLQRSAAAAALRD